MKIKKETLVWWSIVLLLVLGCAAVGTYAHMESYKTKQILKAYEEANPEYNIE